MFKSKPILLLSGLEILALASYLWHQAVSVFIGWGPNRHYVHILLLIASIALCATGLYKPLQRSARNLSPKTGIQPSKLFGAFVISLSPLLFLFLIFLQYFVFLKDIRGYLLSVSLIGSAFLILILLSRLRRAYPQSIDLPKIINILNPNQISSQRLAWLIFFIAVLVYIIYASGLIFPSQPFTGDEPHYLLTTKSIVKDGDINVYNNYRDMDYSDFYPGELRIHAFPGKKGDKYLYSKHFVALSALMAPTYVLGEKVVQLNAKWSSHPETKRRILVFFARLPICLFAALFSLVFFLLILDITHRKNVAVLTWAVFSFTSPILFFSHLLYPELPVSLLTLFSFRFLILKKNASSLCLFLSGAAIGLLPWFGIKYIPLSALLFAASALIFLSNRKAANIWKKTFLVFVPIVVSGGFYLLFFWAIYGNISPVSAYTGVAQGFDLPVYSKKFFAFPFITILSRSIGYFIDQKVGILIYSPLYLLGFAGIYFYLKKKRREVFLLLVVMTAYWIFSANYYWGGYCPPGRPTIPVLWIWGLFLAVALAANQNRVRKAMITAGTALSAWIVWTALKDPWILYHEQYASELGGIYLYSKLTRALSNAFVQFHDFLPSLKDLAALNWLTLVIWIIFICTLVIIYIGKNGSEKHISPPLKMAGHLCFVLLISSLLLTYVFFDIHLDEKEVFTEQNYELYFQDDNHFERDLDGFWSKGKRRTSVILKSPQPLSAIQVTLTSSVAGTTSVQIGPSQKKLIRTKRTGLRKSLHFSPIKGFPMQKGYLYTVTIEDSSGFVPYQLDRNVKDNRYLGVFVQFKTELDTH